MLIKRREFLQAGALATTFLMLPKFLKAFEQKQLLPKGNKVLVIIQLSGGNDGLNTIIPVNNDLYYKERPGLAITKQNALSLNAEAAINPALPYFKTLYDEGYLGILNSVGYPNPDRSHFRSMDIWQSGSTSDQYLNTGWLGRYLDAQCSGCDKPTNALEIDDVLSLALKGENNKALAFTNINRLQATTGINYFRQLNAAHEHGDETVDYLYKTMSETLSSADYIYKESKQYNSTQVYPTTSLGKNLKTIGSLISSGINTRVYYVSLGSFDTHVNQANQQKRLFIELNDAIEAFVKELKANHRLDDVMLMTFSEFGRRVSQNASGGTDHGLANNMFFISGGLKQRGLINAMPDLADLNEGDLKHTVDFKNVYATILNKWLDADDAKILGNKYNYLEFI